MGVKAPGVVKFFGEHAVVYGKLSIAAAVSLYATSDATKDNTETLKIKLADFDSLFHEFSMGRLNELYSSYKGKSNIAEFISKNNDIDVRMLPYAVIASRLHAENGASLAGISVSISSEIPKQKGLASSAACAVSFTVSLIQESGAKLSDEAIIDIARDGERVVHKNEGAGKIDVSTSYYGGVVSYSAKTGAKREDIPNGCEFMIVDTGPKRSTAETVGHIAQLYKEDNAYVEARMDMINGYGAAGLEALKAGDTKKLGALMYQNQEALKQLGVSSDSLEKAVEVGKKAGAYGLKLSGGGGGGIAIAVTDNPEMLTRMSRESGFEAYETKISAEGAAKYARQ